MRTSSKHFPVLMVLAVATLVLLPSCAKEEKPSDAPATYALKGTVTKVEPEDGYMSVAHEEIPGFMEPMTMSFRVKDSTAFGAVQVGDAITATLVVSDTRMWLEGIRVVVSPDTTEQMP